ncbi:MAG: Uncharacterised protein [Polaribacter sp. SA4-10]|nr:MAG: Uncharacterised protein [Polaribacter sp. SA4-10]
MLNLVIKGGVICVDQDTGLTTNPFLLESKLEESKFTVHWYLNNELVGTGPNHNATKAGDYRVETVKLTVDNGVDCNYAPTIVVVEASIPKFEVRFLTEEFVDVYAIEVHTIEQGLGEYLYAIDSGPFQSSNQFENVIPGEYTITIRDVSEICNDFRLNFVAIKYPKFFTPNNDGKNDTWNITDLKNDSNAVIKIFTRFGKLITIIKPNGIGWDGVNKNGLTGHSNDYWFLLSYTKNGDIKTYRNHFSLLRK